MHPSRKFLIRESSHRVHNPLGADRTAAFGRALRLEPGMRILDFASGSGEMLCAWAAAHRTEGVGVDLNPERIARARSRATELGVAERVRFVHGDAAAYVNAEPVDVTSCIAASWIAGGARRHRRIAAAQPPSRRHHARGRAVLAPPPA